MSHVFPRLLARHKAALLSKRIRKICGSEVKYKKLRQHSNEINFVMCKKDNPSTRHKTDNFVTVIW